jgi:hypothetical protein
MLKLTLQDIRSVPRVARNAFARALHRSDYARWGNAENLEKWWETRTQKMAGLVPKGSRVIEFGAGSCRLRDWLDESCEYVPSDIVPRGPNTVICDLNHRPLPSLRHLHVNLALFAGVLEYVGDIDAVMSWLSQFVKLCVVSYDCVPQGLALSGRLRERFRRQYYGYLSDYTEEQLLAIFASCGFKNSYADTWTNQRLFVFTNDNAAISAHENIGGASTR